jgi:probable rRNA maturation factor
MAGLHKKFLGLDGPTDVLTFELERTTSGECRSGEIVLCVPFAKREAARRRTSTERELLLYGLHGVLHLSGFDDLTESAFEKMHAEEDRILTAIGIGAVFSA